jgi:hypothetical protein
MLQLILMQTEIPTSIINKALETSGFSFLAGFVVGGTAGIFFIIKWLDIPDKLLAIDNRIERISNRQKRIFETLYEIAHHGKKSPTIMEDLDTEND